MNVTTLVLIAIVFAALFVLKQLGQVKPDRAVALLKNGGRVVDVRTADEFRSGSVPGAVNIPLAELQARVPIEFPDTNQPLLLHCASGARSAAGRKIVQGLGYTNVVNLGSFSRADAIVRHAGL